MAISDKTKFRITIGTMLGLIVAVATGAWSVAQDRGAIISAVQANSARLTNCEQAIVNLANKVDGIDKNGTTRGQPLYSSFAELARAQASLTNEVGALRSEVKINNDWVIKSLENLQKDRGLTPPRR